MTYAATKAFWRSFIAGGAVAVAANTAIYVAARVAGVDFFVTSTDGPTPVPYTVRPAPSA